MRRGATGRRPTCRPCRCSTPTTRCGSTRCWARRAIRRARSRASWRSGPRRSRGCPTSSSCRATGRGRRWRAIAATACRWRCRRSCTAACWRWRARGGRACSWCCRRRWRCCSPGWGRAATSRSAARLRAAPTARSTTWSGSSSTPWCCAPTRRAIRASASCSRGCGRPTSRPTATRTCRSSGWWRCSTRRGRWRGIRCSR